jgi:hypothetical protein
MIILNNYNNRKRDKLKMNSLKEKKFRLKKINRNSKLRRPNKMIKIKTMNLVKKKKLLLRKIARNNYNNRKKNKMKTSSLKVKKLNQ